MKNELRLSALLFALFCLPAPRHAGAQSAQGVRRPALPAPEATRDEDAKAKLYGVKNAEDADEWFARGDELERSGDKDGARAAFAEAVKRHLKLYLAETSGARVPPPWASAEERARFRAAAAERLRRAAESANSLQLLRGGDAELTPAQLAAVGEFARLMGEDESSRTTFFGSEAQQKAKIIFKPEPVFPEEARRNNVQGRVVLAAVLAADGGVHPILVLKGLPHGLTEASVSAASRTKFDPAVNNGKPVSQFIMLEYNFNTY
jgi:TonB family protein